MKKRLSAILLIMVLLFVQLPVMTYAETASQAYDQSLSGAIDATQWQNTDYIVNGEFCAPSSSGSEVSTTTKNTYALGDKWSVAIDVEAAINVNNMNGQPFGVKVGNVEAVVFNRTGGANVAETDKNAHISLIIDGVTVADYDLGADFGTGNNFSSFSGVLKMTYRSGDISVYHKNTKVIEYKSAGLDFSNASVTIRTAGNWLTKLNKIKTVDLITPTTGKALPDGVDLLDTSSWGGWTGDTDKIKYGGYFTCADYGTYTIYTADRYDLSNFKISAYLYMATHYPNFTNETQSIILEGQFDVVELKYVNDLSINDGNYYTFHIVVNGETVFSSGKVLPSHNNEFLFRSGKLYLLEPMNNVLTGEDEYAFELPVDLSSARLGLTVTGNYIDGAREWRNPVLTQLTEGGYYIPEGQAGSYAYAYQYGNLDDGTVRLEKMYALTSGSQLREVALPGTIEGKTLTQLGAGCCSNSYISKLTIPDTVTHIEAEAIKIWELVELVIPASVANIDLNFIRFTDNLERITVDPQSSYLKTVDDVVYTADGKRLVYFNQTERTLAMTEFEVPYGVEDIGAYAFSYNENLQNIVLPNNLKRIGNRAFSGCAGLTSISLPDSLTVLGEYAFTACDALSEIEIPKNVKVIPSYCFSGCVSLESVYIPAYVQQVDYYAFAGCENLTTVTIQGDTQIDSGAFVHSNALQTVYCLETNVSAQSIITFSEDLQFVFIDPDEIEGDANGDFVIDSSDVLLLEQMCMGLVEIDAQQISLLDFDGSGSVGANDLLNMRLYVLGLKSQLK